jgi:autotransporter-associated beta strand protein
VSVAKNGTGTWTLSGVNTYTGATTLSSGRLVVSGSFTSNITATSGTLVPNNAPSTTGNLSLNSGARLELRPNLDTISIGGSITLTGNLDIMAAPGLSPGSTYTILNKTSSGVISGTFAGKPQGSTFAASGYNWTISYTGGDGNDVTLTIPAMSPIEQWRQLHFGNTTNNDLTDSNNDGEGNLLEYATGQNPHANTRALTTLATNANMLDFTYTKNKSATDIIYSVEWSENFTSWSTVGVTAQILSDTGTVQTIKASLNAGTIRRFMRLKVTKP